ncbi:MAG: NAD(P)-binding protein [Actinomycetes bacterium]
MTRITTDYLVVGAGATGMAFADALVAHSDADVVLVDRRHAPGGHWHDAYPFVRLHVPSANYGVASTRLGDDRVDEHGPNAGMYELASAAEICAYFSDVLEDVLLPTGRVRFFGQHDHQPGDRLVSRVTGHTVDVDVRRRVVDATFLETDVPSTHVPPFSADADVRVVPVNGLARLADAASSFVVLGGGKTGIDACLWLLRNGVDAAAITWVRPRDMWLNERAGWQPLDQVGGIMSGIADEVEAVAAAGDVDDLMLRLEACGRLRRTDPDVLPGMYRCATVSDVELDELRRIPDVVRLGRAVHVGRGELRLEGGTLRTSPDAVHVDCAAIGLRGSPPRRVFAPRALTVQPVRTCSPTFNAALLGYLESTDRSDDDKNRLCPPNPYPSRPLDWLTGWVTTMRAEKDWAAEPDLAAWLEGCRLNLLRGLRDHLDEPRTADAVTRFGGGIRAAIANAKQLLAQVPQQRAVESPSTVVS